MFCKPWRRPCRWHFRPACGRPACCRRSVSGHSLTANNSRCRLGPDRGAYRGVATVGIPEIGQAAPDFSLHDQSGAVVSLKDLTRDGPAVIIFYRGYWCPFCKRLLRQVQKRLAAIRERGAHLVAIAIDPPELSQALAAVLKLEFPLLSDPDSKVIDAYGVRNELPGAPPGIPHPATFVIDGQGVVRFAKVSRDPRLRTSPELIVGELDRLLGVQANQPSCPEAKT